MFYDHTTEIETADQKMINNSKARPFEDAFALAVRIWYVGYISNYTISMDIIVNTNLSKNISYQNILKNILTLMLTALFLYKPGVKPSG
jgi:hypothetical protein